MNYAMRVGQTRDSRRFDVLKDNKIGAHPNS